MDLIAVTHDKLLLFWGLHKAQTNTNAWGCPIAIYKDYHTTGNTNSLLRIYNKVKTYFTIAKAFPSAGSYTVEVNTVDASNVPLGSINTDMTLSSKTTCTFSSFKI